jgi:hypothetical protein
MTIKSDPRKVATICQKKTDGEERIMAAVGREARKLKMSKDDAEVLCRGLLVMFDAADNKGREEKERQDNLVAVFTGGVDARVSTGKKHFKGFEKES